MVPLLLLLLDETRLFFADDAVLCKTKKMVNSFPISKCVFIVFLFLKLFEMKNEPNVSFLCDPVF